MNSFGRVLIYTALLRGDATGVAVMLQTASVIVVPMVAGFAGRPPRPTQIVLMFIVAASCLLYLLVRGGNVSLGPDVALLAFLGQLLSTCGDVTFEFACSRAVAHAKMNNTPTALVPLQVCVTNDFFRVLICLSLLWLLNLERVTKHASEMLEPTYICLVFVGAASGWVLSICPAKFGAMTSSAGYSLAPLFVYIPEAGFLRPRPADTAELLALVIRVFAALGGDILAIEVKGSASIFPS